MTGDNDDIVTVLQQIVAALNTASEEIEQLRATVRDLVAERDYWQRLAANT